MKVTLFSLLLFTAFSVKAQQGTIAIPISTEIFFGNLDEWIHLKITDTLTNQVWYDTLATVTVANGFRDTVYLDSATYKCDVLDIGANVNMPAIKLDNGTLAQYGYPEYEYYLFTLPSPKLGISEQNNPSPLMLYPNPALNAFTVEVPDHLTYEVMSIKDHAGRTVSIQTLTGDKTVTVDTSHLPFGMYFIEIGTEEHRKTTQLIKIGY